MSVKLVQLDLSKKPLWFQQQVKAHLGNATDLRRPTPLLHVDGIKCHKREPKKLNATEAEYLAILQAAGYLVLGHECWGCRVGEVRCVYWPDFLLLRAGWVEAHEVKGRFVRDDARVKFQSAVKQWPQIVWVWAQRDSPGVWNVERYNDKEVTP